MKRENFNLTGTIEFDNYLKEHFSRIYSGEEYEELMESSLLMDEWSRDHCFVKYVGGMEEWAKDEQAVESPEELSCNWYHGTWQYMRLLNMVAVPRWYRFYHDALSTEFRRKPDARVMISACADYGMLHAVHAALVNTKADPTIIVYDICKTPLKNSEWYARKHNFKISCFCDNIITADIEESSFDVIVTDEFLTVLKDPYKPLIIEKWKKLIKPDGAIITTAMIGAPTTPELRKGYEKRAYRLFEQFGKLAFPGYRDSEEDKNKLFEKFEKFAGFHTRHMIRDENQIKSLFKGFKYLSVQRLTTPGECVNPTDSFQVVARLEG
jgi:2-polyprenyl-3-methyl-5-hydroxy-6-metoxy-1,4-benzoquinol methylase